MLHNRARAHYLEANRKPENTGRGLLYSIVLHPLRNTMKFLPAKVRLTGFLLQTAFLFACSLQAQVPAEPPDTPPAASPSEHERAERELKKEEKQRILRVVPQFNMVDAHNAAKLSPGQKFQLAFKSATDPFTFAAAGIDAGLSQLGNDFPGYGQGASGYGKRLGASYADTFDGTMIGNALLPVVLHQDPRYFRKGSGGFFRRAIYAVSTTVICKGDNGHWQPNYSNFLGNVAAGGIANLYYPAGDRGVGLIFERAFTVSAEGAAGAILTEFWPDISRRVFHGPRP